MNYDENCIEIVARLGSSINGISDQEAKARLEKYGFNELSEKKKKSLFILFLKQFQSFIVYILIVATVISAIIGEWVDSIAIGSILVLNALFGFIQEFKAGKAIEALKKLGSLRSTVLREGTIKKIDSKEVVPGDIIIVEAGDRIAADSRIIECANLETEEGSLTGESVPVHKELNSLTGKLALGDQRNMLFSGTSVTKGRAKAIVVATGMETELGKIAGMIESVEEEQTPMQKKLQKLGVMLGYLTIIVCIIVFLTGIIRGESLLSFFMVSVALAVAVIPEGLPAVVTISLALGVQRMVKKHALIRNLPSVETLGSTTVICTDKTGTLTKNEMTVTKFYTQGKIYDVTGTGYSSKGEIYHKGKLAQTDEIQLLLRIGILNNDSCFQNEEVVGDPTEACLLVLAEKGKLDKRRVCEEHPRIDEIPFDSSTKRMVTIHERDEKRVAYIKGAPEVVLKNCSRIYEKGSSRIMSEDEREGALLKNREFAKQSLRVLAFAYKNIQDKFEEQDLVFVGLVAMIDPPRPEVRQAIEMCKEAGIKVIIVTGDYEETAKAIAKEIGIEGRVVNGNELDAMKDLEEEVSEIAIFSRVNPEHKIRIVDALQKRGHIVAMTGDGVNDAPALKKAHLGIAMGIKGTDVAKEASGMILTDDNFSSIVSAVEEGRAINDNTQKFVAYLLSCNLGELLLIFCAMLIGFRDSTGALLVPLIAVQILWLNLVTDGLPALALGLDPIGAGVMKRKPANPNEGIINKKMVYVITLIGAVIACATLIIFWWAIPQGPNTAQTMAFTALVFFEMVQVLIIRHQYSTKFFSNKWLAIAMLSSIGLQMAVMYTPLSRVFETVPLGLYDFGIVLLGCAAVYLVGTVITRIVNSKNI